MGSPADPYNELIDKLVDEAAKLLEGLGAGIDRDRLRYLVTEPPRKEYGDLSLPVMRFLRGTREGLQEAYEALAASVRSLKLVRDASIVSGYLNVVIDEAEMARRVFGLVVEGSFPAVNVGGGRRVVVEHTSANPVHPLHIGHARNSVLGDVLANLLSKTGHVVERRFYVNDMGRQVATLVFGMEVLGGSVGEVLRRFEGVKEDHAIGLIYAATHTIIDIMNLKRRISEASDHEERQRLQSDLDELLAALTELKERMPRDVFDKLLSGITSHPDPESRISELMRLYEEGDSEVSRLFKEVVSKCIEGFEKTLRRLGVSFDRWDWESELVKEGWVDRVIDEAIRSKHYVKHKGADALDFSELQEDGFVRKALGLPSFRIPPLILRRSDGTTLYTTRDIAYSLKKFREFDADAVINVIAAEQRLEQLQIRLALLALGYRREALNMVHYAYEMVSLPGLRMSGRRGRYVTLDAIIDEAVSRARLELEKREGGRAGAEAQKVAEAVGVGAIRYFLASVSAGKQLVFDWNRVLDFERNSAPYLQYTHARASSILRKAGRLPSVDEACCEAASEGLRRDLVLAVAKYPYVLSKAASELRPELVVDYINKLADLFNSWYPVDPVIREADECVRNFKLLLVHAVREVVKDALELLGVPALERM